MKTKKQAKSRSVTLGCLAAQVLGHTRTAAQALTERHMSAVFPAFNAQELANALAELLDKELLIQKGSDEKATYTLTEYGRSGRVMVA